MKTSFRFSLLLSALIFFGLFSSSSAQWTQLPVYAGYDFLKIDFPDDNTGYAKVYKTDSADIYFAKTTDGGNTWNHVNMSPLYTGDLQNFHFSHPDTGLIAWRAVSSAGMRVERTFDGGTTWTDISPDTSMLGIGTCGLFVIDGNNFHFSVAGVYYRTTDAGASWDSTSLGNNLIEVLDFADAQHGMGGIFDGTFNYGGGVYHTSDGGNTMTANIFPETNSMVNFLSYPAVGEAYAFNNAYSNARLHRSTDGGITWDTVLVAVSPFDQVAGFAFKPGGHGFLITNYGYIFTTTDGGDNWTTELIPDTTFLNTLNLSNSKAWIGGIEGRLFVTDIVNSAFPEKELKTITVFPNPVEAGEFIRIDLPGFSMNTEAMLLDLSGRVYSKWICTNSSMELQLPELAAGIYLLRIDGFENKKLMLR